MGERMGLGNGKEEVWLLGGAANHLSCSDRLGLCLEAQGWTEPPPLCGGAQSPPGDGEQGWAGGKVSVEMANEGWGCGFTTGIVDSSRSLSWWGLLRTSDV